jgi:hypothetical protein
MDAVLIDVASVNQVSQQLIFGTTLFEGALPTLKLCSKWFALTFRFYPSPLKSLQAVLPCLKVCLTRRGSAHCRDSVARCTKLIPCLFELHMFTHDCCSYCAVQSPFLSHFTF